MRCRLRDNLLKPGITFVRVLHSKTLRTSVFRDATRTIEIRIPEDSACIEATAVVVVVRRGGASRKKNEPVQPRSTLRQFELCEYEQLFEPIEVLKQLKLLTPT